MAALPSIVSYFGADKTATWQAIATHEEELQDVILSYLRNREGVTIYGEPSSEKGLRVPVVSFTVKGRSSKDIVDGIESRSHFGCRSGHFYSKRMVDDLLGLEGCNGVVRVSMVHYNTCESLHETTSSLHNTWLTTVPVEEVQKYVQVLDEVLSEP